MLMAELPMVSILNSFPLLSKQELPRRSLKLEFLLAVFSFFLPPESKNFYLQIALLFLGFQGYLNSFFVSMFLTSTDYCSTRKLFIYVFMISDPKVLLWNPVSVPLRVHFQPLFHHLQTRIEIPKNYGEDAQKLRYPLLFHN